MSDKAQDPQGEHASDNEERITTLKGMYEDYFLDYASYVILAVGLSTKIMPHNFIELCKESIKILQGKKPKIYPDFPTGGTIDVSDYQWGKRGGKIKIRAKIEKIDNHFIAIRELPYGMTTSSLIDSILKAVDKGKIRVKKVQDNTAAEVEILIELASGISPDVTIDALYAFTNCELSVSPNACVIIDGDKPHFISVLDILEHTTHQTKALLKMELMIKQKELEEKLHFASLEKIFIQERIYRDIEEAEDFPEVIDIIRAGLEKYFRDPQDKPKAGDKRILLLRPISEEDIVRLTEIRIKRISKYNKFKADERMAALEEELKQVKYDLEHLTEYAIAWYEMLLKKYGKGRERQTTFDSFEKTYNLIYLDGKTGRAMGKRFNVKAITRDRAYSLHKGAKGSKLLYFSANPNGEAEIVNLLLSPSSKARVKDFDFDFAELAIKGRGSGGNIVTRYPVRKVTMKEAGKSTLGALKVWMDEVSGRLNLEERGQLLGGFDTGDKLLVLNYNGTYELEELDMTRRYDPKQVFYIGKYHDDMVVSAVYYEGERKLTLVKRFEIETSATGQQFNFITDHRQSKLYLATVHPKPEAEIAFKVKRETQKKIIQLADFIDVKGWKSLGNKLHDGKLTGVKELNEAYVPPVREAVKGKSAPKPMDSPGLKPGDTIELDF